MNGVITYRIVPDTLLLSALERQPMSLVLDALWGHQALDLGSLGVRLLALALGLDLTANDELADLGITR